MCSDLGSPFRHPLKKKSLRVETAIGEDKQLIDIANRENTMYGEALGMWVIVIFCCFLFLVFTNLNSTVPNLKVPPYATLPPLAVPSPTVFANSNH